MVKMELPPRLISDVENGNMVLMLGAGASLGATGPGGTHPPTANGLARILAAQFLPAGYENYPLNQVAEYSTSEHGLAVVQQFIADLLVSFIPTDAHRILTSFRWRGIATTNYDRLIELAYAKGSKAAQRVIPVVDNTDKFEDRIRNRNDLLLLKLHGCVTRVNSPDSPLLLGTDQYVSYEKGRNRLFARFKDWASERSVLFVGYGLQDQNLRQILQEIENEMPVRPRYYFVSPGVGPIEEKFWANRNITAIQGTFEDLFETLDSQVSKDLRGILQTTGVGNEAIADRFIVRDTKLSKNAKQFIDNDVDYVKGLKAVAKVDPTHFYKGVDCEWSGIEQELDVSRHLMDTILVDHVLEETSPAAPSVSLVIVKAYAGAGKSVLLRRLAWNAANSFDKLCLFVRREGIINPSAIAELTDLVKEPIFLFVEAAIDRRNEIESLFSSQIHFSADVTVIATVRTNEWNQAPASLRSLSEDEYELPYLSRREIDDLLVLLGKHKALGRLADLSYEQRLEALMEKASRQLLVALHEATLGKPFVTIVRDEYDNVTPVQAQQMYLTVCFLNQFNVPVRASIIARMHAIPYERFKAEFFGPLEGLVTTVRDRITGDYVYAARHAHIAEIVVESVLEDREQLYDTILKHVHFLNPSYKNDRIALSRLLNGRTLLNLFPEYQMVSQIYTAALKAIGEDPFILQQRVIYEMNRPNGNLNQAGKWLNRAIELSPTSKSIQHTLSELYFRKAESSAHQLERTKYLDEAAGICVELKRRMDEAYPYYTLIKIGACRIRDAAQDPNLNDITLEDLVRSTEKVLAEGLQRFPNNSQLKTAEVELATVLEQSDRILRALQKAFELNPRNNYIAMRLARHYTSTGQFDEGIKTLRTALDARPGEIRLHYVYAKLLVESGARNADEILYHAERAYTPGDSNYDGQFLHVRQLFVMGKVRESRPLFTKLRRARMDPVAKRMPRMPMPGTFTGVIDKLEVTYDRICRDGDGEWVFINRENTSLSLWNSFSIGTNVRFEIWFSMYGAIAQDVELR